MKEELYIYTSDTTRELLDIPSPSGITLKWENNLFGDISKLSCSHSYTFKLPLTQRNIRLLDLANDIRHRSMMVRIKVKAEFYINGVCLCPNANLYVSEVSDTAFSCVMTWKVLKAFETLKTSSLNLNELPSVGNFTWKDGDDSLVYGYPTDTLKNTDNILYPAYDPGLPYEEGTPPKPVVPVYRLIQMINAHFGVKFDIGRALLSGMGTLPAANFNNKNFYGHCVYDDFVTYGVIPITGIAPFLAGRYNAAGIPFVNLTGIKDGSLHQEGAYRRFTKEDDNTKSWRENQRWRAYDVTEVHHWGGMAAVATPPDGRVYRWNRYIGMEGFNATANEGNLSEEFVEQLNMWKSSSNNGVWSGRYRGYDVHYAKRTIEYGFHTPQTGRLTYYALKLTAQCTIKGTASIVVSKAAVTAGRTSAPEYWWIYLVEAKKDEEGVVTLDKLSDEGEEWVGLRSVRREETNTDYIYYFDFGVEYEQRKLTVEAAEDDSLGILLWSGYEYTPPSDDTVDLSTRMGGAENVQKYYDFPEHDFNDTFSEGDVLFQQINIASVEPSVEYASELPVDMDIVGNLPQISCFDFMKSVFYMNGAIPRVEKDGETIVAMYYNQLRDRMLAGQALDWSDKLIEKSSQAKMSKYESSNFGQKNYFEMAYSKKDKKESELADEFDVYGDGYGIVGINDSLLDEEKSLFQSKFYPGLRQDIGYPNVSTGRTTKIWDGEKNLQTEVNPIYGFLNFRALDSSFECTSDSDKRPMIKDNGVGFRHIRMNTFEPFDAIDELFGYLADILENYVYVKEQMRLTEIDLQNFDESMPVYLNKYNSFFAVSTIQRDKEGISTVELIQLPHSVPTYKTPVDNSIVDAISYGYVIGGTLISFELNLNRTYTSNRCPLCYDLFVNGGYETWSTTYNTLTEPVTVNGAYLSRFVYPYNDKWDGNPYTLRFFVPQTVSYTVTKKRGFDTVYTQQLTAVLRVYYDDELLEPGWHTKTFTKEEDGQYHIFKFAFDVYNREEELLEKYRKKLYYFVYAPDTSVITDDYGDDHEGDTSEKVNTVKVTGAQYLSDLTAQVYTLEFGPDYATIHEDSVEVTANVGSDVLTISNVTTAGFTLQAVALPEQEQVVTLTIRVTLEDDSTFDSTHTVRIIKPSVVFNGKTEIEAVNGKGSAAYTISTRPTAKPFTITSITSDNQNVTVSSVTGDGFTLAVDGISADATATITAVLVVDGQTVTGTMEVKVKMKDAWSLDLLDEAGALIVDINGMFYTENEWKNSGNVNSDAEGVAVSDGEHRFIIAKKECGSGAVGGYRETGVTPTETGYVITSEGTLVPGQFTTESEETAFTDFNGLANTNAILATITDTDIKVLRESQQFPTGRQAYLGTVGEFKVISTKRPLIQNLLEAIGATPMDFSNSNWNDYLTSTQYNDKREWFFYFGIDNKAHYDTKNHKGKIRAFGQISQSQSVDKGTIDIDGDEELTATGGSVTANYTLNVSPSNATVAEVSVTSSSDEVTISNVSSSGFRLSATGVTTDITTVLTVKARVNGLIVSDQLTVTIKGEVVVNYDRLDEEKVLILATDYSLYTAEEWALSGKTSEQAEGVAVSDGTHRFIIAKHDLEERVYFGGAYFYIDGLTSGINYNGEENTLLLIAAIDRADMYYKEQPYSAAALARAADAFPSEKAGYLGSAGEWKMVTANLAAVQACLAAIGTALYQAGSDGYWTSCIYGGNKQNAALWGSDNRSAYYWYAYEYYEGYDLKVNSGVGYCSRFYSRKRVRPFRKF